MKTSNKLLLGGFCFSVLLMFTGMVYTKNNMIITTKKFTDGSGNPQSIQLLDTFSSTTINIDGSYYYVTLDATLESVAVMADDNIVESIRVSDKEDGLHFYREGDHDINIKEPIVITVGTKNKNQITLNIEDRAKLNTVGEIEANVIVNAEERSVVELHLKNEKTIIKAKDRAVLTLEGSSTNLDIEAEDRVVLNAVDFTSPSLEINLENSAVFKGQYLPKVNGSIEDKAILEVEEKWLSGDVIEEDDARIVIN